MARYMHAAALCDVSVCKSSPVKLDGKKLLEEQIKKREWEAVGEQLARSRVLLEAAESAEEVKQRGQANLRAAALDPVKQEVAQAAEELEATSEEYSEVAVRARKLQEELAAKRAKLLETAPVRPSSEAMGIEQEEAQEDEEILYKDTERYKKVGSHRVRAQASQLFGELENRKKQHEEELKALQQKQAEEEEAVCKEEEKRRKERLRAAEEIILQRRAELEKEEQERAAKEEEELQKLYKVHPIDILQRQIASDLIAEREAELSEVEEANEVSWLQRLDMYLELEKEAWREQAAMQRQATPPVA